MVAKKNADQMSPIGAGVAPIAAPKQAKAEKAPADFSFAVNVVKLNRAKAWVAQQAALTQTPAPVGDDYVDAVKGRYVAIGGLLSGQELAGRTPKRGRVVNVAVNDEK